MEKLEKLKNDVLNYCQNKFDIFYSDQISNKKNSIQWARDDIIEFLSLAEKLGTNLIYIFEAKSDEEDIEHNNEIAHIEVGFLHNGIFHVFTETADWFLAIQKEELEIEEAEESVPKEITEKSVEDLSAEMIEFINKEYKDLPDINRYLRETQRQFWLEKRLENAWSAEPKIRLKIEKVESKVERYYTDLMRKKEESLLPELINECIEWCKVQGLNKVTKSNVKFFLNEKNMVLTSIGEDTLYLKVNHELKKR